MSRNNERITFNITYYPIFENIINILEELYILLLPDEQCRKAFADVPRIEFNGGKRFPCELSKLIKNTLI